MTWLFQSLNLSFIDVWDELERKVWRGYSKCENNILERVVRICKAVIKADGGFINENETLLYIFFIVQDLSFI